MNGSLSLGDMLALVGAVFGCFGAVWAVARKFGGWESFIVTAKERFDKLESGQENIHLEQVRIRETLDHIEATMERRGHPR